MSALRRKQPFFVLIAFVFEPVAIGQHLCGALYGSPGATSPPCLERKLTACIVRGWVMTCDANAAIAELEHLRFKQRRYTRNNGNQAVVPAIKMLIGDWYVDELGMLTREITACD